MTYGGFDNHAAQKAAHDNLLKAVSDSIKAFFDDLDGQGKSSDVLLMTWSEFGRRVAGERLARDRPRDGRRPLRRRATPAIRGIYGPPPDLAHLDNNGNLPWQTDFRSYYGTILSRLAEGRRGRGPRRGISEPRVRQPELRLRTLGSRASER